MLGNRLRISLRTFLIMSAVIPALIFWQGQRMKRLRRVAASSVFGFGGQHIHRHPQSAGTGGISQGDGHLSCGDARSQQQGHLDAVVRAAVRTGQAPPDWPVTVADRGQPVQLDFLPCRLPDWVSIARRCFWRRSVRAARTAMMVTVMIRTGLMSGFYPSSPPACWRRGIRTAAPAAGGPFAIVPKSPRRYNFGFALRAAIARGMPPGRPKQASL